ncbi:hypothetical protein D8674_002168 [Pyrus ussuriensis x Pyrus communis]|uniref:Uncharacterized protein n=1 Tax=Pyrus ussuriensis x Pyrus communis TaxID=2448454 RepID=A0A5N5FE81_9ROSA|nr:hypothetical protein D8674_002168 [Pyrus ussuriensis x Pyrus communis]
MQAMHTMHNSAPQSSSSSGPSQVWLTNSGATNHMTADLTNLSLASPYPSNETIHTANGEDLLHASSHTVSTAHRVVCPSSSFNCHAPIVTPANRIVSFIPESSHQPSALDLPEVSPSSQSITAPIQVSSQIPVVPDISSNSASEIPGFNPDTLTWLDVNGFSRLRDTQMAKPCDTPCLPYNRLLKEDGEPYSNPTLYRSLVGALQYLTFTRPDIAFSVHQVCQFMQNPMVSHFTAVKRILRYLKGTMQFGISYTKGDLQLKAFSDADWAGDPNDRRSTTGLVVFLGNSPISWSSKKQQTVSRSSTEAEYRALSFTSAKLDWIKQLLVFLHIPLPSVPVLFCDNLSAIALSFNPVQHQKTKHIEVDVHFVRERVSQKQLSVQFVSSQEQFADILTKGLSGPLFRTHCCNLMLGSSPHVLEGGC